MIHIKRIRPGNHSALICQLIYNEDMPQLSTIACAIVLFSMGGFALAADTTVYRSEGPNGTVQFSDTPPAEGTRRSAPACAHRYNSRVLFPGPTVS